MPDVLILHSEFGWESEELESEVSMSDVSYSEGSWLLEAMFSASRDEDIYGLFSSDRESRAIKSSSEGEDDYLQVLEELSSLGGKD